MMRLRILAAVLALGLGEASGQGITANPPLGLSSASFGLTCTSAGVCTIAGANASNVIRWNGGYVAGRYYTGALGNVGTALALAANTVYYVPIEIGEAHTFDRIAMQITTGGTANNMRMAIYNAAGGIPTSLVLDAGATGISGTGLKATTISQSLGPGAYFLALVLDGSATVSGSSNLASNAMVMVGSTDLVAPDSQMSGALAFGAFPSTAGAPSYTAALLPILALRG